MSKVTVMVSVLIFLGGFGYLFTEIQGLKSQMERPTPTTSPAVYIPVSDSGNGADYTALIKEEVAKAVAALPTSAPAQAAVVTPASGKQITIIPISTNYSTQSLEWVDVPGSDFYLDLVGDYGEEAVASWEAFINEQHGNGKVFARLFDTTHSIAVVGSDVETNSATSKLETSWGNLAIWRGKNLYRVQIKSEKGFPVYFNSGRLKITY
jgi:hypothetical protein